MMAPMSAPLRPVRAAPSRRERLDLEMDAPLELAWALLSDLEGAGRWHAGLRAVRLGDGGVAPGTGARLGAPWPGNAWVGRVEAPHRLELLFFPDGLGLREEIAFELNALGVGRVRLSAEHRVSGALGGVWLRWRRAQAARALGAFARLAAGGAR
jgi:hypothetical protein